MASFRVEYVLDPAPDWAKGTVFVTVFSHPNLSEIEQFLNFAKNPDQTGIPDVQTAWKGKRILKVEKAGGR